MQRTMISIAYSVAFFSFILIRFDSYLRVPFNGNCKLLPYIKHHVYIIIMIKQYPVLYASGVHMYTRICVTCAHTPHSCAIILHVLKWNIVVSSILLNSYIMLHNMIGIIFGLTPHNVSMWNEEMLLRMSICGRGCEPCISFKGLTIVLLFCWIFVGNSTWASFTFVYYI